MAIKIRAGKPKATRLDFGEGVVIIVRPATAFEVDLAKAAIVKLIAGLVAGETAAMLAASVLGEEFRSADFTRDDWRSAASNRLALVELAALCIEGWEGFVDEDDQPLPLDRVNIALVLRDEGIARRVGDCLQAAVYERVAEKNALSASPNGAVKAGNDTAPIAAPPATPARPAD